MMALTRLIFLFTLFVMAASLTAADDDEETVDLLYPRLEDRGIVIRGHMKANIKFIYRSRLSAIDAHGFLITADGPYWGLPPEAYFCDERITNGQFNEDLPTLCKKLPGIGWQIREMILFRSSTRRFTIAGDDYGILNLLNLVLLEHRTDDLLTETKRYEISEALGRFEIYGRPNLNGERREMWSTMEEARNPRIRRSLCSRLISMVGMMTEKRRK